MLKKRMRYIRNRRSSTQMGVGWGYGYSCHHFGSTRSRPYNKQTDAKPKTDLFVDSRLADVLVLTKRSSAFALGPYASTWLVSGALTIHNSKSNDFGL